jgi:hypothetical protein
MMSALIGFFVLAIVGLVFAVVAIALIGGMISLAGLILFKVAPLLLLGWLVVKLVQRSGGGGWRRPGLSPSDRRWLDG